MRSLRWRRRGHRSGPATASRHGVAGPTNGRASTSEVDEALTGYREIIGTWFRGGDWANQWLSLRHVAGILVSVGRDTEAALLSGAVQAAGAAAALPFSPFNADEIDGLNRDLALRLGDDELAAARRRGALMRADAAVALALGTIDSVLSPAP